MTGSDQPTDETPAAAGNRAPAPRNGDDERASREKIARDGEPEADALGNADGAS